MNRNYPFGWGSNIGVTFAQRGSGPGSEPEVKNTMEIVKNNQVVHAHHPHTNSRAIFYPGLDIFAGHTPDLNNGYKASRWRCAPPPTTATRTCATRRTTTRPAARPSTGPTTPRAASRNTHRARRPGLRLPAGAAELPQLHDRRLHRHAGPTSTAAQTTRSPATRSATLLYLALIYASTRTATRSSRVRRRPGATLKITKDFNLYTAPIRQNTTPATTLPPQAIPTHLESSMVVPANGQFTWDVNPSIRPTPAFEADGEHAGPHGFLQESWTITCTAANGTLLETNKVTVDKGQTVNMSLCTHGHGRRHRAGDAVADARPAGRLRAVHPGRRARLHGVARRPT